MLGAIDKKTFAPLSNAAETARHDLDRYIRKQGALCHCGQVSTHTNNSRSSTVFYAAREMCHRA